MRTRIAGAFVAMVLAGTVSAGIAAGAPREEQAEGVGTPPPKLTISDGLFVTTQDGKVLGAFTIINNDVQPHLLTGFRSPECGTLLFEQWDGSPPGEGPLELTVPAKGRMVFLRGGYHLRCDKPAHPVQVGDTVMVSVSFEEPPVLTAPFMVKPLNVHGVASER